MSAGSPTMAGKKTSARDRLLAAADELFYAEGVHTVGIDRVIEKAGVAKASLYSCFGSKDELIRAYLEGRREQRRQRLLTGLERFTTPRDRLLGVFDLLAERAGEPNYRGCAFYNAAAESEPGGVADEVSQANRAWTRGLFAQLAAEAGVPDPEALAAQLLILYDGGSAGARLDGGSTPALRCRAMAAVLLDAALA